MDLNKMQAVMRDMPQYTELLSRFALHMHLIDKTFGIFNSSNLKQIGDTELTLATGVDKNGNFPSSSELFALAVKELTTPNMTAEDRMRLAMITMISMNLSDKDYQKLKSLLADMSDGRVLENLVYLKVRNDPQSSTKCRISEEEKKAYKSWAKNAQYDLTRYVPRLQFFLEQLMANKLNPSLYAYENHPGAPSKKPVLSNDLVAFRTNNIAKGAPLSSKDKLIVFFLGGITYSEIRVAKEQGRQKSKRTGLQRQRSNGCVWWHDTLGPSRLLGRDAKCRPIEGRLRKQ